MTEGLWNLSALIGDQPPPAPPEGPAPPPMPPAPQASAFPGVLTQAPPPDAPPQPPSPAPAFAPPADAPLFPTPAGSSFVPLPSVAPPPPGPVPPGPVPPGPVPPGPVPPGPVPPGPVPPGPVVQVGVAIPEPSRSNRTTMLVVAGVAIAVALVITVVTVVANGHGSTPAAAVPNGVSTVVGPQDPTGGPVPPDPTTDAPTTQAAPTVDPQAAALTELQRLHDQDATAVSFGGQWAAQLASKNPGIVDQYQTAQNGTHTFQATDILAEHLTLRQGANPDATVVLLLSTDYGKRQLYHGAPLWITMAVGSFGSSGDVNSWCAQRFPGLSGNVLLDQCTPRRLEPPNA